MHPLQKVKCLNVSKFTVSIVIPFIFNFSVFCLCLDLPNLLFTRVIYARYLLAKYTKMSSTLEDKHGLKVIILLT